MGVPGVLEYLRLSLAIDQRVLSAWESSASLEVRVNSITVCPLER